MPDGRVVKAFSFASRGTELLISAIGPPNYRADLHEPPKAGCRAFSLRNIEIESIRTEIPRSEPVVVYKQAPTHSLKHPSERTFT